MVDRVLSKFVFITTEGWTILIGVWPGIRILLMSTAADPHREFCWGWLGAGARPIWLG